MIAVPLGLVALRVRRHTFVVITIAFFFIAQLSASNLCVTGGSSGLLVPVPNWAPATYNNPFYYLALIIAAATVAVSWQVRRSRFGLQLRAIRDDEDRAAGLGVRAMPVKLTALVMSAFITGMAGALWVYFIGEAVPQFVFDPLFDLAVVLMAFFGGLGTVAGPVLGALVLEPTQLYLNLQQTNGYESRDPVRRAVPCRDPVPAARRPADRSRVRDGGRRDAARPAGGPRHRPGRNRPRWRGMTATLRAEGVTKSFGGVQALADCSLTAPAGSITGLIGPNGSGKTTLFNVMTGYERIDAGQVFLGDQRITGASPQPRVRARRRPYLPADPDLPAADGAGEHAGAGPARPAARGSTASTRWTCWPSPASPSTPARWPAPCLTASASCWSWRTCWSPTRPSCCSTSRPAGSTRR